MNTYFTTKPGGIAGAFMPPSIAGKGHRPQKPQPEQNASTEFSASGGGAPDS